MSVHEITPDVDPAPWLAGAQFIDAYRVANDGGPIDAREAAQRMFARSPRWVDALLNLRNLIVAPFGLKTSGAGERAWRHDRNISCLERNVATAGRGLQRQPSRLSRRRRRRA
jgi:hypothetical protein